MYFQVSKYIAEKETYTRLTKYAFLRVLWSASILALPKPTGNLRAVFRPIMKITSIKFTDEVESCFMLNVNSIWFNGMAVNLLYLMFNYLVKTDWKWWYNYIIKVVSFSYASFISVREKKRFLVFVFYS